ncbi:MAG TPA: DUF2127 domain-containing protein [Luteimonas sp.]|nr:DUF2127 domain-containing protein [Luteimonas sp.]HRO26672.1 DUF2127 domain-containing protein [Luteimonas sp.]HRP72666.1 DUF2127 domain-containing protein [Luteimonas sp.]
MDQTPYNPDPHAHPGLHAIALVEAAKGVLALIGASGLELVGPASLQRWLELLITRFQFNPDHGVLARLQQAINPDSVHFAAAAIAAYGVLHLVEAWGLWRARAWASWLGCITASLYIPFEVIALVREPGWIGFAVLAINLVVVWVLARDLLRRR